MTNLNEIAREAVEEMENNITINKEADNYMASLKEYSDAIEDVDGKLGLILEKYRLFSTEYISKLCIRNVGYLRILNEVTDPRYLERYTDFQSMFTDDEISKAASSMTLYEAVEKLNKECAIWLECPDNAKEKELLLYRLSVVERILNPAK
jgi:hypothetical protein